MIRDRPRMIGDRPRMIGDKKQDDWGYETG